MNKTHNGGEEITKGLPEKEKETFADAKKKVDKALIQKHISDFFNSEGEKSDARGKSGYQPALGKSTKLEQLNILLRNQNEIDMNKSSSTFNDKVGSDLAKSILWGQRKKLQSEILNGRKDTVDITNEKERCPPLQDFQKKPVLVGADVAALYPSLDRVITGAMVYDAAIQTDIEFCGFDYKMLAVFLYLIMGHTQMLKCGLKDCIPQRRGPHNNVRSLAAACNRDMSEWVVRDYKFTPEIKKRMIARMLQIETITLMNSSCYSFGGKIYKQKGGAGIGERSSACIAKVVMSMWDKAWATTQSLLGLRALLFFRYIDDIRILLFPINVGWKWIDGKWVYKHDCNDGRNYELRTLEELKKTFNETLESIELTVESELDYSSGYLPTLDLQTRVREDNQIEFKFYEKPMSSGLVIQSGTALSQQTIFTSLRQNLIRRLLNTSEHMSAEVRMQIVENFTQSLINSGHRFSFIKSIILQALTRYEYMKERSILDPNDKRYKPLYRKRTFNFRERTMLKKVERYTWYKNINLGDPYIIGSTE